jgi:pyruvate dehydrogenase E2 component (dihydrolipoamide acetyltransferase)
MRWDFRLPDIGEGVTEGEIVAWLVEPGDQVAADQPMVEVMTDKATVTLTAPKAGKVVETRGRVGQLLPVGTVLAILELDAGRPSVAVNGTKAHVELGASEGPGVTQAKSGAGESSHAATGVAAADEYFDERPRASPSTRKAARDMRIDLRRVRPTGPQGRVTRRDLERFEGAKAKVDAGTTTVVESRADEQLERRVPFAGLRRRIAHKMSLSTTKAAHFTFVEECDVTALQACRESLREPAQARGVKLTFLPFIVKAVVSALKKHPMLNATLDEEKGEVVYHGRYDIGIATATQAGLVVPVVRRADRKSLLEIARDVEQLAQTARTGKASLEDLQGSTFTITSLGAQGGLLATPIINFPEVAILGVHRMKERPVVRNGQIAIGSVMLLSLSFDHRLVDGHVGAAFAYDVIALLEHPERLLLDTV